MIRRIPKLSDAEIVALYQTGQSKSFIALKCKMPDYHVEAVLAASGVRIRGRAEALRLALKGRKWDSTARMYKRPRHAPPAAL